MSRLTAPTAVPSVCTLFFVFIPATKVLCLGKEEITLNTVSKTAKSINRIDYAKPWHATTHRTIPGSESQPQKEAERAAVVQRIRNLSEIRCGQAEARFGELGRVGEIDRLGADGHGPVRGQGPGAA